ncbi:uncharacterized protein LOC107431279 [Ziziphus jujuba]|uniref:Uncharacterized protein LOC107431279 n=2 Tax=Ziziphus jujuba TaxID=326968 RepID=A0A6P4AN49_ZIZJJ|nr:uncharacterized protein LOC107431279 [Ziziphus jujuba]KAH7514731.1 hypothetical protein FEM48_Zijuj11G0121600 [Ziziphus jujuba var. spinosa]
MFSANNPAEIPQKSLQIQQDDKFFSRLLSKESSIANPSLRVYYGGLPGAVPFLWESQPGTPKYKFCDDTLPPLTPPPSYYTNSNKKKPANKTSRSNLLHTLFTKKNVNVKKTSKQQSLPCQSSPVPSFWSSSSSDSSSMVFPMHTTTTTKYQGGMNRFSSKSSSLESLLGDDDGEMRVGSSTSTLCFGFSRVSSSVGLRGCHDRS